MKAQFGTPPRSCVLVDGSLAMGAAVARIAATGAGVAATGAGVAATGGVVAGAGVAAEPATTAVTVAEQFTFEPPPLAEPLH